MEAGPKVALATTWEGYRKMDIKPVDLAGGGSGVRAHALSARWLGAGHPFYPYKLGPALPKRSQTSRHCLTKNR